MITGTFDAKDIRLYVGVSGDRMPTTDNDAPGGAVPLGSRFLYRDSGREYEWQGDAWTLRSGFPDQRVAELLAQHLVELRRLVMGLSLLVDTDLSRE